MKDADLLDLLEIVEEVNEGLIIASPQGNPHFIRARAMISSVVISMSVSPLPRDLSR